MTGKILISTMDGILDHYTATETKCLPVSVRRSVGVNATATAGGDSHVVSGSVSERLITKSKDALHKHTTKFVKYCHAKGVGTIVLGDLTGIRKSIDYGKRANQKLHQWAFGKIAELITYKAKALGIKVKVIDEAYTSQTCPKCGNRKKPTNRNYICKCGFKYHRDGVGAINIRAKYLGHFGVPVVAEMGFYPHDTALGLSEPIVPKVQVALSQIKECS